MPIAYPPIITPEGLRVDKAGQEVCGSPLASHVGQWCSKCRGLNRINRRCMLHGGRALGGFASPSLKTGRHSKYIGPYLKNLPKRMQEGVEASVNDGRLLELRHDIAVVQERIADLLKRVDTGESGQLWTNLKTSLNELRNARRTGDDANETAAFRDLESYIERGTTDYQAWEEISKQFDRKQRLSESERKREVEANLLAPADQTLLLIQNLIRAVMECVIDQETREAIQRRFNILLATGLDNSQFRVLENRPARGTELITRQ